MNDHPFPQVVFQIKLINCPGKNLQKEALKGGFAACLASPEIDEQKRQELRFAIGDKVAESGRQAERSC